MTLTLIASERTVIAGRPVTLTGQITSDDPSCVARQRVMIERRAHGSTIVNQMDLGDSDADGSFSRSLQVQASADYSAWVRRHDACPEARSGTTPVFVRVQVNVTAPTSVARATRLTIAGAVQPAHPEGQVELQRRKDGEWSVVGRRTLDSASKFAFDMPARWTGRRTFRVRCNPRDEDHKGAVSARVRISTTEPRTR